MKLLSFQPPPSRQSDGCMRTDALFYELFQTAPQTFFELLQITPLCDYRFESITVKASEKRIDGVIEPTDEQQPVYFLEVQAFPDETIYWRAIREVATFFEQRPHLKDREWQVIVLWLDKGDDPGFSTLRLLAQTQAQIGLARLDRIAKKIAGDFPGLKCFTPFVGRK